MKYKINDRVRMYSFWIIGGYSGRDGVISGVEGNGFRVRIDGGGEVSAHPKQLRKLKPKQKPVAREIWVRKHDHHSFFTWEIMIEKPDPIAVGYTHYREVLQNPTSNEVSK